MKHGCKGNTMYASVQWYLSPSVYTTLNTAVPVGNLSGNLIRTSTIFVLQNSIVHLCGLFLYSYVFDIKY